MKPAVDITVHGSTVENVTKNLEVILNHNKPFSMKDFRKMVDVFDYHNDVVKPEHITPFKEIVDAANELGYTGEINTRNFEDDPRLNTWAWKDETNNEFIFRTDNYDAGWAYGNKAKDIRIECATAEELIDVVKRHENLDAKDRKLLDLGDALDVLNETVAEDQAL